MAKFLFGVALVALGVNAFWNDAHYIHTGVFSGFSSSVMTFTERQAVNPVEFWVDVFLDAASGLLMCILGFSIAINVIRGD